MQAFQQRVIDEKAELDAKLAKLTAFVGGDVFAGLDQEDGSLLLQQQQAMTTYSKILGLRIDRFQ